MQFLSLAQCVGYVAFVVGVCAYLQKNDRRLKFLNGAQCLIYGVHFALLGNLPASSSLLTSSARSFLALKTRSLYVAALILTVNLAFGFVFAKNAVGWIPVIGSCFATVAIFLMRGIPMRLVMLVCTLLWLVNNILSASIGGTMLELVIGIVNITTILRLLRSRSKPTLIEAERSTILLK